MISPTSVGYHLPATSLFTKLAVSGFRETAKEYYQKANNYEKLITCYQYLEDYDALASCISLLPEKHPLLDKIAETFLNVGMCSLSVDAYLKVSTVLFWLMAIVGDESIIFLLRKLNKGKLS